MSRTLWEDSEFKILFAKDYVVVRKNYPYDFHSHFKKFSGARSLVQMYYKKLQPYDDYFNVAMQRITTEEEWSKFTPQKPKQRYFNSNRGRRG